MCDRKRADVIDVKEQGAIGDNHVIQNGHQFITWRQEPDRRIHPECTRVVLKHFL